LSADRQFGFLAFLGGLWCSLVCLPLPLTLLARLLLLLLLLLPARLRLCLLLAVSRQVAYSPALIARNCPFPSRLPTGSHRSGVAGQRLPQPKIHSE
jgi:hypothetical protein